MGFQNPKGAEEMVQQLRVVAVLSEEMGSILVLTWWLTTVSNSSSRDLMPSLASDGTR